MYTLPNEQFNALEHAKNAVLRANQFAELVVQQFIMTYEDFWGLYPEGGSRYTAEQMQAKLVAMPMATAVDILNDAAAFKTFISQAYPDTLPEKYHESAWGYVLDQQGLRVTSLRPAWEPPVSEQEEENDEVGPITP